MKRFFVVLAFFLFSSGLFAAGQPVIAVFHFENETPSKNKFSDNTLRNIEEKLRSELIKTHQFEVMTNDSMEAMLAQHKSESYNSNRDRAYQIKLGRKISARYIVIGKIRYDGDNYYTIYIEMIDTEKETSTGAGNADFRNNKAERDKAVNGIVTQILYSSRQILDELKSCDSARRTFPCKDSSTGYMWSQRASRTMYWSDARDYCRNLTEGGYSDWHLPSLEELKTIIGSGSSKFGDIEDFWSSTTPNNGGYPWYIDFSKGTGYYYYNPHDVLVRYFSYNVRCVRR